MSTEDNPYEEPLGGSYVVDKTTGERKRVEFTRDDHLEVKPAPEPAPAGSQEPPANNPPAGDDPPADAAPKPKKGK